MRWAAVLWSVAMWIWWHIDLAPSLCEGIDGAVLHTKEHRHFAGPKFLSMWLRPRGPWQGRDLEKPRKPEWVWLRKVFNRQLCYLVTLCKLCFLFLTFFSVLLRLLIAIVLCCSLFHKIEVHSYEVAASSWSGAKGFGQVTIASHYTHSQRHLLE